MATKAERFRYQAERSGPKRPKKRKRPRRNARVDTSQPGVSATDRRAVRKPSARGKRATVVFEESATGRRSRKSSRRSANRAKGDNPLKRRQTRRTRSAKTRAAKGRTR